MNHSRGIWDHIDLDIVASDWLTMYNDSVQRPGYLFHNTYDSVLGKRVLTYWENRGNLDYTQMNVIIVAMKNYIFLESRRPHLSKNV